MIFLIGKKIFVLGIFLVFLISNVFSATVTDSGTSGIDQQSTAQSFAQVNIKLTELSNQIAQLRSQDQNFKANAFMKSDLQNLYDNMVNINRQTEQQIILDNIIIVVMAFAIMFLLIGKGLLPQNNKPKENNDVKKPIEEEKSIVPQNTGGV